MSPNNARATLERLLAAGADRARDRVPLIGLAGAQGSGKSTLARGFGEAHPRAAVFSLDDFYLTAAAREELAATLQPLLRTRGVPGTHDLALLDATIAALQAAGPGDRTPIPTFDKLADDRAPRPRWRAFAGRPDAILIEGWCLGALPQPGAALDEPINALERAHDPGGSWRRWVNSQLAGPYAALFARFDALAFLRAPSIEQVVRWRCEQQEGLLGRPLTDAESEGIAAFVAHFERITRHMLAGGVRADILVELGQDREMLVR